MTGTVNASLLLRAFLFKFFDPPGLPLKLARGPILVSSAAIPPYCIFVECLTVSNRPAYRQLSPRPNFIGFSALMLDCCVNNNPSRLAIPANMSMRCKAHALRHVSAAIAAMHVLCPWIGTNTATGMKRLRTSKTTRITVMAAHRWLGAKTRRLSQSCGGAYLLTLCKNCSQPRG